MMLAGARYTVTTCSCAEWLARQGYNIDPTWCRPPAPEEVRGRVTIAEIKAAVADHYDIPRAEMVSERRSYRVSHPRQVAMYLAAELTPMSLPQIGRAFGNRDHTTVIHARRAVEKRSAGDADLAVAISVLTGHLLDAARRRAGNVFDIRQASPIPESPPAWCDQCERRVSAADAARCTSQFCNGPGAVVRAGERVDA